MPASSLSAGPDAAPDAFEQLRRCGGPGCGAQQARLTRAVLLALATCYSDRTHLLCHLRAQNHNLGYMAFKISQQR